jgi:hypothetical protein
MRFTTVLLSCLVALGVGMARPARAEQPRDWMVAAQPGGTYANLDVIFPGIQAQIEHRMPIYGQANELNLKVNALPTLVFYESQADVDVRLVILSLGASVGIREVFHALEFQPAGSAAAYNAQARRDREFGGDFTKSFSGFGEGRVTLALPFNDNLVFNSINAVRYEGGRDRVFDWRLGIMRDSGTLFRSDTTLYLKATGFGAIGPRVQILNYKLDHQSNTQINYGFTFTTRPGFRRRNDILFISLLLGVGGTVNGIPTDEMYGNHLFKIPATFEIAYRTVLEISGPSKPNEAD